MAKVKHNPNAGQLIDEGIAAAEPFARAICKKLRAVILKAEPAIVEDWKWGPNYYKEGMVCGFWHFKKHVNLVFFQGALLKDKKKILLRNPGNVHNRHIKFTDVNQVDEKLLTEYITEAVMNNEKGLKLRETVDKNVTVPEDLKRLLAKHKLLAYFENLPYSHKKEYVQWIEGAKKEETRQRRLDSAIIKLKAKEGLLDKYKKK